jgi:hypothetical protein
MKRGFAKIRAGIEEHFIAGKLGAFEVGVYLVIHLQADFRTGIWIGSTPRILATVPRGASRRKVQHALERLSKIGFIRAFRTQGARGNYHVLIDKYEPQSGALKGKRLNAWGSESWKRPFYEACAESVTDTVTDVDTETDTETAPYQDVRSKKQKAAAPPARLSPEDSVWSFLEITPCGPINFRTLLESRWSYRNGDRLSVLIGETVDAWEVAEGQKLRRAPQLFRALADLRQKEQTHYERTSLEQLQPIRVLTAAEIPA